MSAAEELRRPRRDAARRPTARHSAADPSDKDPVASSTPAINTNIEEVFLRLNDTRPIPVHWAHRTTPFTHPRSMALSSLHLTLRTNILCYKTTDIVAIMCLNLGVDPPDCIKPVDCPKLEAWINPHQLPNSYTHNGDQRNSLERARDLIGKSLQQQFSSLQSQRLAVHMLMDPAIEVIQRKCARIQRGNHGRVVFYYNGHGVPRPTSNGDIWAFDEAFEQYIPASAADVRDWMPSPAVFIWECANAQTVMEAVMRVTSQRAAAARNSENPDAMMYKQGQMSDSSLLEDIHFAATSHRELLPTNPEIPVDLFTSCLTTPIRIALRFWVTQNPDSGITMDMVDNLPGPLSDRRTPLGEINWIFVTITDTIAWTVLPRKVFYKLFRQDVLVSTLLRNYLLAERVMRYYGRHPTCSPSLPLTHKHPLWEKWDMEVSLCLGQLPKLLKAERWRKHVEKVQKKRQERQKEWEEIMRGRMHHTVPEADTASSDESPRINLKLRRDNSYDDNLGESDSYYSDSSYNESEDEETVGGYQYVRSDYFEDQLRAFDVWLQHAWMIVLSHSDTADGKSRVPRGELPTGLEFPVALPAVLQVILNVRYRHQALMLFYQFISLGPWAVDLAMAVGIIRYIVRLLQSNSREIRDVLIMICARMVAVDPTFRQNLEKENINYFILYLFESLDKRAGAARKEPAGDSVTEKLSLTVCSACAFILTIYCHNNPTAQEQCFEKAMQFPNQKTIGLVDCLLEHLSVYESDIPERMHFDIWIMLCLAQLWSTSPRVKWYVLNKQLSQQASQDGAGSDDSVTLTAANEPGDVLSLLALMSVRHDPRIRATAVYAIGTLLSGLLELGQDLRMAEKVHYARSVLYTCLVRATNDGSPMVRQELVYAIARAVAAERTLEFVQAIALLAEGDFGGPKGTLTAGGMAMARHAAGVTTNDSLFGTIIELTKTLLILSSDPQPDIGRDAERILDVLFRAYLHSTLYFRQAVVLRRVYSEYAQSKANAKKKSDSNGGGDGNGSPESQGRRAGALHQMLMDRVLGLSSDDINLHRQSHPSHRRGEGRDRGESASALHYSSSSADLLAKSSPKSAGEPGMHRTNSLTSESRRDYMARSLSDRPHSSLRNRPASLIGLNEVRFRRGVDSGDDGHSNGNDDEGVMTDTVASDSDAPLQFQLPANLDLQDQTVRARLAEVEQAWVRWAHGELATRLCQSYIIDWMGAQYAEANKHASDTVVSNNEAVRRGERERQVKRVTEDCNAMSNLSTHMRWGGTSTLRTKMLAVTIVHHPFMPHLIVADKKGSIHTYNWETNRSLGSFVPDPDKSSPLVRVEKLHLINPRHEPLLMVGSSDGVVRVFRSYMGDSNDNRAEDHLTTGKQAGGSPPPPSLMTALRVVPQKLASASHALSHVKSPTSATSALDLQRKLAKRNSRQQHVVTTLDRLTQAKAEVAKSAKDEDSGIRSNWKAPEIVTEWNQMSGYIYAGGRDNTIQIWDINSERHVRELITQTFEGLSCLSSDQHSGNILVVGGCSGRVRVLDCRVPDRSHFVQTWRVRPGSVINCFIRPEMMKVITASNSGVITTTDLRSKEKALSIEYMQADQGLDHFDIHPQINVMASASTHLLKLWNMQPKLIGEVNSPPVQTWSRGQLSQGKADITGAAFHPYLPIVTMSMNDGGIMNVSP